MKRARKTAEMVRFPIAVLMKLQDSRSSLIKLSMSVNEVLVQ